MARHLITGANRGIGLELARRLVRRGEEVWAACREPSAAAALAALAGEYPDRLNLLAMDVSSDASVREARASFGDRPLDVLINNAGVVGPDRQSSTDMDFDGFRRTLEVNTLGPLRVVQAFLDSLRLAKGARIVTLTSRMGQMAGALSDHMAYRASKAAANKLMQGLATDLAAEGIAVAALHPGWVRTDMGGPEANLGVEEAVDGVLAVIDGLDLSQSGHFLDWRGKAVDW
jgi:NAD(P)-dependent dehydrogenase (short-subunit alcohol dehydrogenase family)